MSWFKLWPTDVCGILDMYCRLPVNTDFRLQQTLDVPDPSTVKCVSWRFGDIIYIRTNIPVDVQDAHGVIINFKDGKCEIPEVIAIDMTNEPIIIDKQNQLIFRFNKCDLVEFNYFSRETTIRYTSPLKGSFLNKGALSPTGGFVVHDSGRCSLHVLSSSFCLLREITLDTIYPLQLHVDILNQVLIYEVGLSSDQIHVYSAEGLRLCTKTIRKSEHIMVEPCNGKIAALSDNKSKVNIYF
jgi:hypothetical protein